MKTGSIICLMVVTGSLAFAPVSVKAQYGYGAEIAIRDVSDFYQTLAPFGYWVQLPSYGWCWYPVNVDRDWRPYANGHWLWSDSGWYWASEEPWAWACYHYGRWTWDSYYGWVWAPGTEWAPAWVDWRDGGGYIGWAPLPPGCDFGPGGDVYYPPQFVPAFVFVEHGHFCDLQRPSVLIVNQTIFYKSVHITKIKRVNNLVVNCGPNPDFIRYKNPGRVQEFRPTPGRRPPSEIFAHRQPGQDHSSPWTEDNRGGRGQPPRGSVTPPAGPSPDAAAPRTGPGRRPPDGGPVVIRPQPQVGPEAGTGDDNRGGRGTIAPPVRGKSDTTHFAERIDRPHPQQGRRDQGRVESQSPPTGVTFRPGNDRPDSASPPPQTPGGNQNQPARPVYSKPQGGSPPDMSRSGKVVYQRSGGSTRVQPD